MKLFDKLKIRRQYKKLMASVDKMRIFDGRGKGVDIYICEKCGRKTLTRYKDKGVTPFVMQCPYCNGDTRHENTVPERVAAMLCFTENIKVLNWVRPPLWWLLKHKEAVNHVIDGGLVLEQEVLNEIVPHTHDKN